MLEYTNIYQVAQAADRLRSDYYRHSSMHSKDSDAMVVFTLSQQADRDAQHNLDFCLDVGKKYRADYLVLHDNKIQFIGRRVLEGIMDHLAPGSWRNGYMKWSDSRSIDMLHDGSGCGEHYSLRPWRRAFANSGTRGIYSVDTGQRIKNRREIITRFWDLGYATWRGRPLSVAPIRWSGTKDELETVTDLANKFWNRRHSSDAAKKMCSAYTSLNRYAAWPGSW